MSSPDGSVFRYLGDGLRLQIANCASRSAPFPRRSLAGGAEATDPGAGAAYGGQRWAGGSHRQSSPGALSGATMKAAIWHRPLAATQEAIGVLTIGAAQ